MRKCFLATILIYLSITMSFAQERPSRLSDLENLQEMMQQPKSQPLLSAPIIEHAVDEKDYILGPGDVLNVVISGQSEENHQLMIRPEGVIVLPAVGNVDIAGKFLFEAKKLIFNKINTVYLSDVISITLIQLRSFRVTVSGAVINPGLYPVNALNRVSDAIELSGGFIDSRPTEINMEEKSPPVPTTQKRQQQIPGKSPINKIAEKKIASKRNIIIKRRNGTTLRADILRYKVTGNLDANPYLLDGDVIIVTTEQDDISKIMISGAVKTPDEFEYVEGDRIKDLLEMAHGFAANADSNNILLIRFESNSSKTREINLSLDTDQRDNVMNTLLKQDDRIFVRAIPNFHRKRTIEIQGQVVYPGKYALKNGPTSLSEIIEQAGGFTKEASLHNAYLERRSLSEVNDPEFERLQKMLVADMTTIEREYFKTKSRERAGVAAIDFSRLFDKKDKSVDFLLQDKDLIIIPAKDFTVNVSGQIIKPGLISYSPNKNAKYYIEKAGGYNFSARKSKVRIIKASTGEWLKPDNNTVIEMGDTIFVPEKPERDNWRIFRDIVTVAAQVATIYLVFDRYSTD